MCFKLVLIEDINQCPNETLLGILNESMDSEATINMFKLGRLLMNTISAIYILK